MLKHPTTKFYRRTSQLLLILVLLLSCSFTTALLITRSGYQKKLQALSNRLEEETALQQQEDKPQDTPPQKEESTAAAWEPEVLDYASLFPNLYVEPPTKREVAEKTVYLTFDDGPSPLTPQVLDILKEKQVKATFFVTGQEGEQAKERMQRIVSEGHAIGVHTYSHDYRQIYQTVDTFLEDFDKEFRLIEGYTGVKPKIFRFAGGSINAFNMDNYHMIIGEMIRRGFTYFDWNVSAQDASKKATKQSIHDSIICGAKDKNRCIILLHDSGDKADTIAVLPQVIDTLKSQGYTFAPLTNEVQPIVFPYERLDQCKK